VPDCTPSERHAELVHAALAGIGPGEERHDVLVGAVVVCEWMDDTGRRWFSQCKSPNLTSWHADGLMQAAQWEGWEEADE
jgi:hypothetical protein